MADDDRERAEMLAASRRTRARTRELLDNFAREVELLVDRVEALDRAVDGMDRGPRAARDHRMHGRASVVILMGATLGCWLALWLAVCYCY